MYESKKMSSLRVLELDKYIDHQSLSERAHKMKKKDKVSLVQAHIAIMAAFSIVREERMLDQVEDSEDEDDVVLNEWGTSEKDEDL